MWVTSLVSIPNSLITHGKYEGHTSLAPLPSLTYLDVLVLIWSLLPWGTLRLAHRSPVRNVMNFVE